MTNLEIMERLEWLSLELYELTEGMENESDFKRMKKVSTELYDIICGVKVDINRKERIRIVHEKESK